MSSGTAIDPATNAVNVVGYDHHEIHEGDAFMVSYNATLAGGLDAYVMVTTPNTTKWAHMVWGVVSDAAVTVYLYETYTGTHVGGNALTARNRNRNSSTESGLLLCHTPSGAAAGTIIWQDTAGAAGTPLTSSGGSTSARGEVILKQNEKYLFRIDGADTDVVTINLDWYEHTSIE